MLTDMESKASAAEKPRSLRVPSSCAMSMRPRHRARSGPARPRFRLWLQKELPGFLRETDRKLFDDILEEADGKGNGGGENDGTPGEKSTAPVASFQTEAN